MENARCINCKIIENWSIALSILVHVMYAICEKPDSKLRNTSCLRNYRTGPGDNFRLLHAAEDWSIVFVSNVISPISRTIRFNLGAPAAKERKAVSFVLEIPVFVSRVGNRLQIMQCAPRPESRYFFRTCCCSCTRICIHDSILLPS